MNLGDKTFARNIAERIGVPVLGGSKEAIKQVALGIGVPPADYAVAPDADVTIVVYPPGRRNKQKVTAIPYPEGGRKY